MSSVAPPPSQPAAGQSPTQAPGNPTQVMLAQIYQVIKKLAQEDPRLSDGLEKAAEGIQDAQTAMLSSAPGPAPGQSPPL